MADQLTDEIYARSRAAEEAKRRTEGMDAISQAIAARRAALANEASGAQGTPAEAPAGPPKNVIGSIDDILDAEPTEAAAATPSEAPAEAPAEPENTDPTTAGGVASSLSRGPLVGAARLVSSAYEMSEDLMTYLFPETMSSVARTYPEVGLETRLKEQIGPQSGVEAAVQDLSGVISTSVAAGFTKPLQAAGWLTKAIVGNAVGAAALPSDTNTLVGTLHDALPDNALANNPVTSLLDVDEDDTKVTQILKNTLEGVAFEKALTSLWMGGRAYLKERKAIQAGAKETELAVDEGVDAVADELVKARLEKTNLDAALAAASKPALSVTPEGVVKPQNYDPAGGTITVEPGGTALLPGTPTVAPAPFPSGLEQAQKVLEQAQVAYKKASKAFDSASTPAAKAKAQRTMEDALVVRNAAKREVATLTPPKPVVDAPVATRDELIAERRALYDELRIASDKTPAKEIPKRGKKVALAPKPGDTSKPTSAQEIRDRIAQIKELLKTAPKERPTPPPKAEGHVPPVEIPEVYPREIEGVNPNIVAAAERRRAAAAQRIADSESKLVAAFESSTSSPVVLRVQAQALKETGQLSAEAAAKIDEIVTHIETAQAANAVTPAPSSAARLAGEVGSAPRPPSVEVLKGKIIKNQPKVVVADHLELSPEQHTRVINAFKTQNLTVVIDALGDVFDVTNFDKIAASEDIKNVIEWIGKELGENENTFRLQLERSIGETFRLGESLLEKTARESGSSVAEMNARLLAQFPAQDLTRTLTAYRMFELAVVKKAREVASEITALSAVGDSSITKEAELFGLATLSALINDRRAGLVSDIGRALNSLRAPVAPAVDLFRHEGRQLRGQVLEEYLRKGGGRSHIRKIAAALAHDGLDSDKAVRLVNVLAKSGPTFGDALHAFWISNLLSGPFTQLKNVTSSQAYMMLHDTASTYFDAAARDAYAKAAGLDPKFAQNRIRWAIATRAKTNAWWKTIQWDVDTRQRFQQAWKLGRRITANPDARSGVFTEMAEGNFSRAKGLAEVLRGESHFKGLRVWNGVRLLPRSFTTPMADALEASAAVSSKELWSTSTPSAQALRAQRYGTAASIIDMLGRLNSWPLAALAGADELNAGIARASALDAEAFGLALERGLQGDDAMAYIRDLVDNIHTMDDLAARGKEGLLDADGQARLADMITISDKADDYVRRMTFTQPADKITQAVGTVREYVPGGRWNLVFVRTPSNILKAGVTESPYWQASAAIGQAMRGNNYEAAGLAGKAAYSSGLTLGALALAQSGQLTGSGPLNPEANEMWRKQGNRPYTWTIGGVPFNYGSYIDPVALPLQVVAEAIEAFRYMDEGAQETLAHELVTRLMRLAASKSWVNAVNDWMTAAVNPNAAERQLVRVTSNFVPQSRLLAQLNLPAGGVSMQDGFVDVSRPGEGQVMTVSEYLRGQKPVIDRGEGFALEGGEAVPRNPGIKRPLAFLVSTTAEPLPDDLRDWFIKTSSDLMKIRVEGARFQDRDLFYRTRVPFPGEDPEAVSSVHNPNFQGDPIAEELRRVGLDYSTRTLFGTLDGIKLSPEQADYYHQMYNKPTKDIKPIYEAYKKLVESDVYKELGDSVVGVGKGEKYKQLFKIHSAYIDKAQIAVRRKFPEVDMVLKQKATARNKLRTQEGSDEVRVEIEQRRYQGVQAFLEGLNLGSD